MKSALFLFTTDTTLAITAVASGVDYLIVDWERDSKKDRQAGTGFQIGEDTVEDVVRLAIDNKLPVFVRVNPLGKNTEQEIATAVAAGCVGIMLPMARDRGEVSAFLSLVPMGIKSLVQIETKELAANPLCIADLPWDYAHVGLNDLKLSRGSPSIWTPVLDGTVEQICKFLEGRRFGFGGITVVDGGFPIPARLVINEMARLGCSMGILRRSFTADVTGRDMSSEIIGIRRILEKDSHSNQQQLHQNRLALENSIRKAGG